MDKEYKVVAAYSVCDLEKEVTLFLKSGWTLAGGIAIFNGHHGIDIFYQSMYRETITSFYI